MAYKTVFLKRLGHTILNGHQLVKIAQDLGCLRTESQAMTVFLDIATQNLLNAEELFIILPTEHKIFYMTMNSDCWEHEEAASLNNHFNITTRVAMLVDAPQLSLPRASKVRR